jgi:hypothetical protein
MIRSLLRVSLLCAVLVVPSTAFAQAQAGDKEVLFFGLVNQDLGGEMKSTFGNVNLGLGFFVTDRFQIAFGPSLSIMSMGGGQQLTGFDRFGNPVFSEGERTITATFGMSTKAIQFFGAADSKVKPYVGGELYINDFESAADTMFAGANFGVKNYLNEKAAIDFSGTYGFNLKSPGETSQLRVLIGLTYIF